MDTSGNQRQWKGEERSLPSVQEDREAKRLATLAVLPKGLTVGILFKWKESCAVVLTVHGCGHHSFTL